jgi:hypothetical protein
MYFQIKPTRCNDTQFVYFYKTLYIFQAVPPPIIRSSKSVHTISVKVKQSRYRPGVAQRVPGI